VCAVREWRPICYGGGMRWILGVALAIASLANGFTVSRHEQTEHAYLGFDRNDYPGDAAMAELRKQFVFTGYWLTPPPEEKTNSWAGKRSILQEQGYGFLLLARGRQLNKIGNAAVARQAGRADAQMAAQNARTEGFRSGALIFLDVEDGGRLPAAYHQYLKSWADELLKEDFRPGVYCSGMPVEERKGATIVTAEDIRANEVARKFAYWVFNDACPPSPGCIAGNPPLPKASGVDDAVVWQIVRSPREKETAGKCAGYAPDGNCYAGVDAAHRWFLDIDIASSANPSFAP
jgi:Domain of unknown function (DUF1906)